MPGIEGEGIRINTVDAGTLWLDGGAMFGVVPKPLWTRRTVVDGNNRIPLAMRCLLIESSGRRVLVDTGLGNKESDRFREMYRVDNAGRPTRLEDSLRELGVEPEGIELVVNTHLHFDHAGGNIVRAVDGSLRPAFPNARYLIRRGEWEFAHLDNERIRGSYLPENFELLAEDGRIDFIDEDTEVLPGVWIVRTRGHTPFHQSVLVDLGGEKLLYLADLVPTRAHLRLPWIMGYDVEPLLTLESKREHLERAAVEGWLLAFEHDPHVAWGRAAPAVSGGGCILVDEVQDPLLPVPEDGEGAHVEVPGGEGG